MNGARSIFMRKGYWLTALAAIVLLAASPWDGVGAGHHHGAGRGDRGRCHRHVYRGQVKGFINPGRQAGTVTVTLVKIVEPGIADATVGEATDYLHNLGLSIHCRRSGWPADVADDVVGVAFSSSGTIRVQTLHDLDAEDEGFDVDVQRWRPAGLDADAAAVANGADITGDDAAPTALTIEDDETQSYDLTTDDDDAKEGDGDPIMVTVTANPAHVHGSADADGAT